MTDTEIKRKQFRLSWLMDKADEFNTDIYDNDISILTDEIEAHKNKDTNFPPMNPIALIEFYIEKLGIEQKEMAEHLGLTKGVLNNILKGRRKVTAKFSEFILDFDFESLNNK